MNHKRTLMMLRALHGFTGEIAAGASDEPEIRDDGLCYNCDGQGVVFPGMPGRPTMIDTSRVVKCPVCGGTGKSKPQRRLF